MALDSVLDFAKRLSAEALGEGGIAVDATVGNGHDTLFLARTVGAAGHVYGFDVQEPAVERTRQRLEAADVASRVTLIRDGHEAMDQHVPDEAEGRVAAVMFNLGYLPGGDKSRITTPATTIDALDQACRYLQSRGVITVVQYVGHEGGMVEAEAVNAWAEALDQAKYQALTYRFINQRNNPPRLLAISRR
jgi:16S rRNA C1402 N4-methylase RsmH